MIEPLGLRVDSDVLFDFNLPNMSSYNNNPLGSDEADPSQDCNMFDFGFTNPQQPPLNPAPTRPVHSADYGLPVNIVLNSGLEAQK